jgi:predicted ATP-dependent endonuclease of OLD family
MMRIKKLKLKNFKKFTNQTFDFNDDINVIVGDNESGKSSLLEAIEACLCYSHRGKPLTPELTDCSTKIALQHTSAAIIHRPLCRRCSLKRIWMAIRPSRV